MMVETLEPTITLVVKNIVFYPHRLYATFVLREDERGCWMAWQMYGAIDDAERIMREGTPLPVSAARVIWPHLDRKRYRYSSNQKRAK